MPFKYELIKIWKNKFFIGTVMALAVINLFLLWYFSSGFGTADNRQNYKAMSQALSTLSESEKKDYITKEFEAKHQNKFTSKQEREFMLEITNEVDTVSSYQEFLSDIENKANVLQSVGIFKQNPNDFSYQNIMETKKAFASMKDVKINFTLSKGLISATDFVITDLIILLLMLTLSTILMFSEKENGLLSLIKSTKNGRAKTAVSKIIAIGISVFAACTFFYLTNLIYCEVAFGLGDFSNSLQSISFFSQSTLKISIFQYLILFLLTKGIAFFTISIVVLFIAILSNNSMTTYLSFGGLLLLSAVFYFLIPATSSFNWLKYVNVFSIISTAHLFANYLNLNFLSQPINFMFITILLAILLFTVFIVLTIVAFCKKRDLNTGKNLLAKWIEKLTLKRTSFGGLFSQESYKLLMMNKSVLILVVFCVLQLFSYQNKSEYLSMEEYQYKNYMTTLSGELNREKIEFIEKERAKFDNAHEKLIALEKMVYEGSITKEEQEILAEPYQQTLQALPVFEKVEDRFQYLKSNPNAQFVYETGYYKLFGITPNNDLMNTMFGFIMLVLCCSSIFSCEYKGGMDKVIKSTYKGRHVTVKNKILSGAMVSLLLCLLSYLPELFYLNKQIGFSNLMASATSLPELSFLPSWISVVMLMIIMYALRLLAILAVMILVFWLSNLTKNNIMTLLLASLIFICPVVLTGMNLDLAKQISVLPIISVFSVSTAMQLVINLMYFIVLMAVSGMAYIMLKRAFCKTVR